MPWWFCYSCSISFSRSSFDSMLAVLYCQRELFWLALSVDQHYQMLKSASTPKNVWMFIACKWHQQTNLEGVLKLWLFFCGCMKSVHYRVLFIILTRVKTPLTETVKHPNTFLLQFLTINTIFKQSIHSANDLLRKCTFSFKIKSALFDILLSNAMTFTWFTF